MSQPVNHKEPTMNQLELTTRIKFLYHKQRRVLLYDFTGLPDTSEAHELIRYAREVAAKQAPHSLFTLTDISDSHYDKGVTSALQELAKHNKPYVIAGAAVGVSGLSKIIFRSILAFSGRKNIQLFDTREQALDWLATYDTQP